MNKQTILSVHSLYKTFTDEDYKTIALNDVSFEVNKGEMLAIMGTSGSGKSTLLNILGALDKPDKGYIVLKGEKQEGIFEEPAATKYRSENIGFIFQSFHLLKDLSVEENIALPLILNGTSKSEIKRKLDVILEITGLQDWRNHMPYQLSGGQQQRVAIGRALIMSPPILLADEPTGNLDFNTTNDILNALVDMKERLDQSIIMVTHDVNVASYADRILFFHNGKIVDTYKSDQKNNLNEIIEKFRGMVENI